MEKQMSSRKIPQTDSIEELARFWDTHDLTDFEDQLEEVTEPVFERITVRVHLQPKEIEAVKEIAKSKGIDSSGLIGNGFSIRFRSPDLHFYPTGNVTSVVF